MVYEKAGKLPSSTVPAFFGQTVPRIIVAEGSEAARRFLEFFTANIRNRNTRAAYARAVGQFCTWCERRRFSLILIEPRRALHLRPWHSPSFVAYPTILSAFRG